MIGDLPAMSDVVNNPGSLDGSRLLLVAFNGAVGILVSVVGGFLVSAVNRLNTVLDKLDGRLGGLERQVSVLEGYREGVARERRD